jgi:hypothetical protein
LEKSLNQSENQYHNQAVRIGKYRHYKGNFYEVLSLATHSETLEAMVVYRALYGVRGIWVRPLSMWDESIATPDGEVKRFQYVGEMDE